jgi:hypothetical protein
MHSHHTHARKPEPQRVSHVYLFIELSLVMSALFVMAGTARLIPRDGLPWQISLPMIYGSAALYIMLMRYVLWRCRISLVTHIAITPLQAFWVPLYVIAVTCIIYQIIK